MVDRSSNTSLIVLEFYPKYRIIFGYYVYATEIGVYQGNMSDIADIAAAEPFLVLNSSRNDRKMFMANHTVRTFEITYDIISNTSTFTVNSINRTSPSNLETYSITEDGNWTTLLVNYDDLSCALLH